MRVVRERPDGVRSCVQEDGETPGSGGRWVECSTLEQEGGLAGRFREFFDQVEPRVREEARADVEAVIEDLFERAEYGELHLRRSPSTFAEVAVMKIRPEIYELIVAKQRLSGGQFHLRVYFTEPTDEPGVLLALSVEWKRDEWPEGRDEQDEHAKQAFERFKRHTRE